MAKQTLKDIFSQLKADLIGKDSYRGVTLSYSWLANQLGQAIGSGRCILLFGPSGNGKSSIARRVIRGKSVF